MGKTLAWSDVVRLGAALPDVEEATSYGTAALKVKGKLFARLKEDGETLVLKTELFERELLLSAAPGIFFLTDHYAPHPWVLVRLGKIGRAQLAELLATAHRLALPVPRKKRVR